MKQLENNRSKNSNLRWLSAATLIGVTGALGAFAQADNAAVAPKVTKPMATTPAGANAETPANNMGREERQRQRQAERQQQMQQFQNMTPEEREKAMAERRATGLRRQIQAAGVTDAAQQTAILEYMESEQTARAGLRAAANKLQQGLRSNAITDAQVSVLLNEFRDAVDAEKNRRANAAKELDAKVSYSKNPRLEAMLTVMGAIGEESSYLTPMGMGGGRGRGAMAGGAGAFGQGQGRGQNARGNRNRAGQNGQPMNTTPATPAQ